jgi:methylated-DNA-[protein]-cysteine S-methyltransferase
MGVNRHKQQYFIFDTAAGLCGIAWNEVGITRLQLPTPSQDATQRMLRRRGEPPPEVLEAVAAIKSYFVGEPVDIAALTLDLSAHHEFYRRIYEAARRLGLGAHHSLRRVGETGRRDIGGGA